MFSYRLIAIAELKARMEELTAEKARRVLAERKLEAIEDWLRALSNSDAAPIAKDAYLTVLTSVLVIKNADSIQKLMEAAK